MPNDLDITVGRDLTDQLCIECRERLRTAVRRRDIMMAVTPGGLKRLARIIQENSCPSCRELIAAAGVSQGRRTK
jgi:hypothetical protein